MRSNNNNNNKWFKYFSDCRIECEALANESERAYGTVVNILDPTSRCYKMQLRDMQTHHATEIRSQWPAPHAFDVAISPNTQLSILDITSVTDSLTDS